MDHSAWPGADLVVQGIRDLERGAETIESLLVSLSAPRLRALGLTILEPLPDSEVRLYRRLAAMHGDGAHARYNAFVRRIVSFQRAGARARQRPTPTSTSSVEPPRSLSGGGAPRSTSTW